ncbi:MAG TPA: NifB/NifX family molybdenum-iron cluster-binding protein [Sedimentisphaerales bacterium]|nr:NifB/NifX family molybdenum-iron cluster-binding protein [Sedimentisphaerales bacterium]
MRVAVTSTGTTLEHYVGTRVNRCGYLLIVDTDTMRYQALQNPVVALSGPAAGKMFAQLMLREDVRAILAGGCGSDVLKVLGDAGIQVLIGVSGSVRRAVEQFRNSYHSMAPQQMTPK